MRYRWIFKSSHVNTCGGSRGGRNCPQLRWDPWARHRTPTAPRAQQCRLPTAPGVCALGWVKCREHISLLVILCKIVYVTNKKNKIKKTLLSTAAVLNPPFSFQTSCRVRLLESRRYNSLHCSYYTWSVNKVQWFHIKGFYLASLMLFLNRVTFYRVSVRSQHCCRELYEGFFTSTFKMVKKKKAQ